MKHTFRILALLAVIGLIGAACGGAATPTPAPTEAPAAAPTEAPTSRADGGRYADHPPNQRANHRRSLHLDRR